MMTAEERRIEFYGDGDARAYDHDELYIMNEYAKDFHQSELNKFRLGAVIGSFLVMEWVTNKKPDREYCIGAIVLDNGEIRVEQIMYDTNLVSDKRIVVGNYGWCGGSEHFSEKKLIAWMPLPGAPSIG